MNTIQRAVIQGQHDVAFGILEDGKYAVVYGLQEKTFPRTTAGLSEAVGEFESCHAHALQCANNEAEEEGLYDDGFEFDDSFND